MSSPPLAEKQPAAWPNAAGKDTPKASNYHRGCTDLYVRFDLSRETVDTWALEDQIQQWAQDRDIRFTKKIIWNHHRREYRVCFLEPRDYTLFVLTWPDWAPGFDIVKNRQDI